MIFWWLRGLWRLRFGRMAGTIAGTAITIALIASFGAFVATTDKAMTGRAVAVLPVDWQVEFAPVVPAATIVDQIKAVSGIDRQEQVGFAAADGFEANTTGSLQETGAGKVLGLSSTYIPAFPGQIRLLEGTTDGVLLAQQTASNLHVGIGDTVTIHRPQLPSANVVVGGIVDLPNADTLFQAIGVPQGSAPQAPPDNVVLMPLEKWASLFLPQAEQRPDTVRWQIHASFDRGALASDPLAAWRLAVGMGHNLELHLAGQGTLGNNLAARLDAVRSDALYALVLLFFLGAPGVVLAAMLTMAAAASGADQRRRDQAILRQRGATHRTILSLAAAEAGIVWLAGGVAGLVLAFGTSLVLFGGSIANATDWMGLLVSPLAGLVLTCCAILFPAWWISKSMTVVGARQAVGPARTPIWRVIGLDLILLMLSAIIYWQTSASGYLVVLATEGVAATSVDYWAFLAPMLLWAGVGLLTLRLTHLLAVRGRALIASLGRPIAGGLATLVAASLSREPRRLALGVGLTALAFAFAASTAIFNATYQGQALVDAQLTNGADVTISGDTKVPADRVLSRLASIPGIAAIQPMQHRYAYVGTDLQDLYGVNALGIGEATSMSDAYFGSGDANRTLARLTSRHDGVLVSEETVSDFQLNPGDRLNLRIQNAKTHTLITVPFTYVGIAREFPTAPHDSFLVANTSYLAETTGSPAAETLLIKTSRDPAQVHADIERAVGDLPTLHVSDVDEASHVIGSSLVAVNLSGLNALERGFAGMAVMAAAGLTLALGLADRRRSFAILDLLGATARQSAAFLWIEGAFIFALGSAIGLATGVTVGAMLVALLQGVFDPPPATLAVPWTYLAAIVLLGLLSVVLAIETARREAAAAPLLTLKEQR